MQISFDLNMPLLGRYLRAFVFLFFLIQATVRNILYYDALYTYTHIYTKIYLYLCIHMCIYIYESHTCVCVCVCVYIYMKQVFDGIVLAFIRYETWLYFLSCAFYIIMFCFILLNKILVTT